MNGHNDEREDMVNGQEHVKEEEVLLLNITPDGGLPSDLSASTNNNNQLSQFDGDEVNLLHGKFETIPVKDFASEVRAYRDVEKYLKEAVLCLDLYESGVRETIGGMLKHLLKTQQQPDFTIEDAKEAIFTRESGGCVLAKTIQGMLSSSELGGIDFDQSWICIMCDLPTVTSQRVVIARLRHPANLGTNCQEARFVILVITPTREKTTKGYLETGRTFATLFMDLEFRHMLLDVNHEDEFKSHLHDRMSKLITVQGLPENRMSQPTLSVFDEDDAMNSRCGFGRGIIGDLKRRFPHYLSDYKDGVIGHNTPHKVIATTFFLYFACVLPNLAFGMLNSNNTHGAIGVKKILFSQSFGGILFGIFGGQPLIVLLTTAPLALYTKIIYSVCEDFDLNFHAMFAYVGLWNMFFLLIFSFFNMSKLMRWSSRSTEEIFSVFITFAFSADAIRDTLKDFNENYYSPKCDESNITNTGDSTNVSTVLTTASTIATSVMSSLNTTEQTVQQNPFECLRENSILFLLLMLGTVWIGLTLFNFTKTPFLNAGKREILADYALPISVLVMAFFGSFVFRKIKMKPFQYNPNEQMFQLAPLWDLPIGAIFAAAGLGFSLSLLFFMDQNISSALVNNPNNKLKKGAAYHWDLFVVAIINGFLSLFAFPWVHAALPHSPLHVRALADVEERVDQGHVHQIVVSVRETRLTGIVSHVMIGLSMFLLPEPMSYIPRAVLDGLFLYLAITALYGNQFFERILLLVTEQAAYPPNHYVRRVPQRKVHMFTFIQMSQLVVLCVFGFSPIPYMKMIFPLLLIFLMPIRHKLVPKVIEPKYLKALDGH
ncbi:sodium bicarbonate transporter-like protein 11 isoform X2 [Gigantopelta aegis]|uniref:sodium bicarbonate transporter-like protein 11 isoform X2 n=1 Tax=Gigantopelta aegis TaxID=1735272 RepID=UPI001B88DA4D|nr:sodium bicarbonate transporter-like protein 11 isoform X2 [Gigantopelta aegis]